MFVHVFILVLMGLLTALQPWVGLACSTCMCMQPLLIIITTLIITTLISYHLIASSLSLISLSSTALSLSLASASASISLPSHQHINTSAAHQQHISASSRSHQHHQHHIKLDPLQVNIRMTTCNMKTASLLYKHQRTRTNNKHTVLYVMNKNGTQR